MANAIEAIKLVKYRYLRALDTKHWDGLADTMTEDIVAAYGSSRCEEHHFTNRSDLIGFLRGSLGPGVVTEHRVTHPEITVDGDHATATWYLQDRVIAAASDFMLIGAAFYNDSFRRTEGGWKISRTGYERTYEAEVSLENLKLRLTPGKALQ